MKLHERIMINIIFQKTNSLVPLYVRQGSKESMQI